MKPLYETRSFAVFDDVLRRSEFEELWRHYQQVPLTPVNRIDYAWRLEDGEPFSSSPFSLVPGLVWRLTGKRRPKHPTLFPTGTPWDHLLRWIDKNARVFAPWIGSIGTDWFRVEGRAYVYPPNASLAWHSDDTKRYSGAFVYYAHPEWNMAWGGELLVAEERAQRRLRKQKVRRPDRFDNRAYSEWLMAVGVGHYIAPKPNRLVLIGSNAHSIVPVRPAAGTHVRASLAGFFVRLPETPSAPTGGTVTHRGPRST
jgi:hypothetical protein